MTDCWKQVEDALKGYILTKSRVVSADDVDPHTPLFSSGLLDSLAFVDLALFVRKTFGVTLNIASFDSIAEIRDAVLKAAPGTGR